MWNAAAANDVLDVPLDAKDIDGRVLRNPSVRHVNQPPNTCGARGRTEVLIGSQIDARRAVGARAHVVVRGGDDLIDAAAGVGEPRHIEQIDRPTVDARMHLRESGRAPRQRADWRPRRPQLRDDRATELTSGADDEDDSHERFSRNQ
jgi:hypothetical protein